MSLRVHRFARVEDSCLLKTLWIMSRTRSALVNVASAIFTTGLLCAASRTIRARRQVTTERVRGRISGPLNSDVGSACGVFVKVARLADNEGF